MSNRHPAPDTEPAPIFRVETSRGGTRPLMVAHRCGAGIGPENTRAAVVQSSFHRPDYYEIDIRHTGDGVAICIHDDTLDRTTNLTGKVLEHSWSQIKSADAGSWFESTYMQDLITVPTFETMLDAVNPSSLVIEIKEADITSGQCSAIAAVLNEHNDVSSVVASFHKSALDCWKGVEDNRRTCYLITAMDDYALSGAHDIVGLLATECTAGIVEDIHEAGKAVWVWTVNEGFASCMKMDVDAIITDFPDRLRKALPPG